MKTSSHNWFADSSRQHWKRKIRGKRGGMAGKKVQGGNDVARRPFIRILFGGGKVSEV